MPRHHSTHAPTVVIRAARGSDGPALERLSALDSQPLPLPLGDAMIAERDGELLAALAGGHVIADPFEPTADLVALLRLHAGGRGAARDRRMRLRAPRLRMA